MISYRKLTLWQKTKIACSVVFHRRTPLRAKALLGVGVFYGLMPIDLIPDFLPLLGGLDDIAVSIGVILFFLNATKALRKEMEKNADIIDIKPW